VTVGAIVVKIFWASRGGDFWIPNAIFGAGAISLRLCRAQYPRSKKSARHPCATSSRGI